MGSTKIFGWAIAAACSVVVVYSVMRMSRKVDEYHHRSDFPRFRFQIMGARQFEAFGRPVKIDDDEDGAQAVLRVQYGDTVQRFPVKKPPARDIPSMGIYDEWAKVIEVHEVGRTATGSQGDKMGSGRVVLVTRHTPAGYDAQTWGSVFRDAWTFDFHELKPDGTIETSIYRWPRGEMGQMTLAKLVKKGNEQAKALAAIPELAERTWQYQTALHVIPKLNVPKYRFKDTAIQAMGWTLPTAGFGGLGVIIGMCLGFAPARVRA